MAELNINSIRNKFEELAENITKYVDILLIVETKLGDSFPTNQFRINGYQQFRVDRSCHGGGLLFYITNNIPAKAVKNHILPQDIAIITIKNKPMEEEVIYLWL